MNRLHGQNNGHSPNSAAGTPPDGRALPGPRFFRRSPGLVLVFSLLVTVLAWHVSVVAVDRARADYFDFRVREAVTRIVQRMHTYQQVLLGVEGLYIASVSVEREEFKEYVEALHLSDHYPGIQGIGFSIIVPADARNRHVAAVRREGFPSYRIYPEGRRDVYSSIIYLEPFAGSNLRAFGYDMFSEPVRRAAMEDARDNDRMAMTGKVRLVQESGVREQAGMLLYLPIYRNGLPHGTTAERRANIIGWAYAPFRMDDLMQGIHGEQAPDLDIEIYDGREVTASTLMYDSEESGSAARSSGSSLIASRAIEIAGHPWTIYISGLEGIQRRVDSTRPAVIAAAGIVISLLLAWLTWSLARGREQAIATVRERETLIADLQQAMAEIKTLQGILPICSVCKKIRDDKDAWTQMETFISEHSDAVFSHGFCPDCAKKARQDMEEFSKRNKPKRDPDPTSST